MLLAHLAVGQNQALIHQLKSKLRKSTGRERVNILNDLAWEYRAAHPDSAQYYAQQAYTLAEEQELLRTRAKSLNFIGLALQHEGNNLNAFENFSRAYNLAPTEGDTLQWAHAANNIGRLFYEQGLYGKSIVYLQEALRLFKAVRDLSGLAYCYQSLAGFYKTQQRFDEAELNYREAYKLRLRLGNTRNIMSALQQLGKLYLDHGRTAEALRCFQQADSAGNVIQDAINLAEVKILLADVYMNLGDWKKAEQMGREGFDCIRQSHNMRMMPEAYLAMGRISLKRGARPEARRYFQDALRLSTTREDLHRRMEAYFLLWQLSGQDLSSPDALFHYNQYLILRDSVKSLEAEQQQERFSFAQRINQKEEENAMLKVEEARQEAVIARQQREEILLVAAVLLVCLLLWIQFRYRRRIQRLNRALAEQHDRIATMNQALVVRNRTLEQHLSILTDFSRDEHISAGNLREAAEVIARITAETLQASRVSLWSFNRERRSITSLSCYVRADQQFLEPVTIEYDACPPYFEAIQHEKVIVAHDARTHAVTSGFTTSYLEPLDIHSMLDSSCFLDGQMRGIVCCEQQGAPRTWTSEDILFVTAVADIMSLSYRTAQRREYERQIEQQAEEITQINEVLEARVRERTEELEEQNRKLSEYAFINSHLLRGPLSRILGLIHLMEKDRVMPEDQIIEHLRRSGHELDDVVKKITDALHSGGRLHRHDFKQHPDTGSSS